MKLNLKTMMIAGAVVAAMALEGVVFLLLMPGQPKPVAGETQSKDEPSGKDEGTGTDAAEEPLGEPYNCTNNKEESMMHLRFKVAAVVKTNDAVQFRESVTKHKNRIRQAIEKIFRSAERDELNDANLNALKRSMKEEVNKVLRKSYVDEIVVYDFSMIEQ